LLLLGGQTVNAYVLVELTQKVTCLGQFALLDLSILNLGLMLGKGGGPSCNHIRAASQPVVIRVYDEAGNVIETHEHKGDFKEW
jgi:hypothetical protein